MKKKETALPHLTDDEVRRELLTSAIAWYVRRAQKLGADPMPLLSHLLRDDRDDGGRLDRFLSSREMADEKAAGVLRYYGLIPRKRQPGEKGKTFSERIDSKRRLRNYESFLLEAQWLHRHVPRKVKDVAGIIGAMWSPPPEEERPLSGESDQAPGLLRDYAEIVARHRAPPSKKGGRRPTLKALVAAYVLGPRADKRLAALRKCAKRRTNYPT